MNPLSPYTVVKVSPPSVTQVTTWYPSRSSSQAAASSFLIKGSFIALSPFGLGTSGPSGSPPHRWPLRYGVHCGGEEPSLARPATRLLQVFREWTQTRLLTDHYL